MNNSRTVRRIRRRRVVGAIAGTVATALAGCTGDGSTDDEEDDTTDETDADTDDEPTVDEERDEEATSQTPTELETQAQAFVELLVDGAYDAAYEQVTDEFVSAVPQPELEAIWERDIEPLGSFQGFESTEYQGEQDGVEFVVAIGRFSEADVQYTVGFVGDKVGTFLLNPQQWDPPGYVDETAFEERSLTLAAPGGCELGATLTMPAGEEPVPGAVFVHGSGDQDRDQTVGPNKTFKELAWGLATQGVATLRYDQRPLVCSVDRTAATIDDLVVDDALTAINRLRAEDRIDGTAVVGYSLGGRLAPRIAARDGNLDGVVMLAPLAESLPAAIVRQSRHQFEVEAGLSSAEVDEAMTEVEALAEQLRSLDIGDDELIDLGGGERGRPFYRSLAEFDHIDAAAGLSIPRLLVQGERDSLVTVEDDLSIWQDALEHDERVDIRQYEGLNHRFQPVEGPQVRDAWFEQRPVAEQVVTNVAAFVEDAAGQ